MNDLLTGAAKSATYNVLLQVSMRVLTFALNAFILRYLSRDMLGVVNVRLLLLFTTTQFISREGFRRACLSKKDKSAWGQVIFLMWCSVPVTALVACVFGWVWLYVLQSPATIPHYHAAVVVYALCTVIEAISEPLWLTAQAFLFIKLRVFVEGISNMTKCLITVSLVISCPHLGLYVFCAAQICASLVYPLGYYSYFCYYIRSKRRKKDNSLPLTQISQLSPFVSSHAPNIDWPTAILVWSFFKQSVLKQFLTEGERYVMTIFNIISFADQGVFDIINNLGSLIVRFVFASVEESAYLYFSQTLTRGLPSDKQPKDTLSLCSDVLRCLLKSSILLGLTILTFGYPFAHVALHIYGGEILSRGVGPQLLRWYCLYVFVIAINGVTECFVFAVMGQAEVDRYNHKMVLFSLILLVTSWYLTRLFGVVGLVLANCVNMAARILHSLYFIQKFYKNAPNSPLLSLKLSRPVMATLIAVFTVMSLSQVWLAASPSVWGYLAHIGVGCACLAIHLTVVYRSETQLVYFIKQQYRRTKEKVT